MVSRTLQSRLDKDAASAITFDKRIQTRTVTVEGDVYEPSGVLTGGSNPRSANLLSKLAAYKSAKSELDQFKKRLQEVNKQLETLFDQHASIHANKQRLDLKQRDLQAHQRQFELNPMGKTLTRIDAIKAEIIKLEGLVREQSGLKNRLEKQVAEIEKDMGDFSGDREGKLRSLQVSNLFSILTFQKSLTLSRTLLEKELLTLQKAQQALQTAEGALEAQKSTLQKLELDASMCHSEAENILTGIEILDRQLSDTALKAKDLSERLDNEMRFIKQYDQELVALEERRVQLQTELDRYQVEEKRMSDEIAKYQVELDKCKEELRGLLKRHAWLSDTIPYTFTRSNPRSRQLGQPNGPFNFTQHSVAEAQRRFKRLQEQHRKLKSSININVMEMIDRYRDG